MNGAKAFSAQLVTVAPPQLQVFFTFTPTAPTVGQPVMFSATSTGGTPPVSFSWTFGDGTTGTGATTTHSYSVKGTYTITLTGTDSAGKTATAQHSVTVTPLALAVSFTSSPTSPSVGSPVTFTATTSGGTRGTSATGPRWDQVTLQPTLTPPREPSL